MCDKVSEEEENTEKKNEKKINDPKY